MANNGVRKTSADVPILPKIPRRPPRQTDFGFETIVNEKLATIPKKKRVQKETVGSLTLIQSISFAVVWLWTTIIGVLKVRIQGRVSPKKNVVDEKVKTSSRNSRKTRQKR
ncbi:hypothetical protein LR48_Vigan11g120100 [Vigna angularis]|uniref:Uncharacterized protein n=1 Tax=Phaseolus angularis TaxID=3914 RepID=A0A0L9VTI4_PHAAN|nr:uncharacterized protein HKW66_Vig0202280 [Vigna angularis]KOM58167.1 hypothetical protein LR48_Vigan11g120100 [Vigna angularis]